MKLQKLSAIFLINVAKDIGTQDIIIDESHPSMKVIEENKTEIKDLCFNAVDSDFVAKQIDKINIKKATGKDGISSKILKLSESEVSYPISKLITKSFEFSVFPNKLKEAHVIPLYKKSNTLDKGN